MKNEEQSHIPCVILVSESSSKPIIKYLTWKNYYLNEELMNVFQTFLDKFTVLSSLKLENAHLGPKEIAQLANYLRANNSLIELTLTGNPLSANCASLITNTGLKFLSLKSCNIDAAILRVLVEPLRHANPLIHLNLSSNFLGDAGAEHLAKMLRTNRTLVSLNVADNFITDEGMEQLALVLGPFKLTDDEISERRKMFCEYFLKKHEVGRLTPYVSETILNSSTNNMVSATSRKKQKIKTPKKISKSPSSVVSVRSSRQSFRENETQNASTFPPDFGTFEPPDDLDVYLEDELSNHPFMKDTMQCRTEYVCRGNFAISHLNVSFNAPTARSVATFRGVVAFQNATAGVIAGAGLTRLVMHGPASKSAEMQRDLREIDELIAAKCAAVDEEAMKKRMKPFR